MHTRLAAICNAVLEAGWLLALAATPFFFNIFSTRSFEPDKISLLRSIALIMAVAWIIRGIENLGNPHNPVKTDLQRNRPWYIRIFRDIVNEPCVLFVLLFLASYAFSTITSIFPKVSFYGSYSRMQGLYTFLSYGLIFFVLIDTMKGPAQIERFLETVVFVSIPISCYGILQHFQFDPIPWTTAGADRISGANLGNPIFVAAYLIMVVPLTAALFMRNLARNLRKDQNGPPSAIATWAYGSGLVLQILCIVYTQSRGPWIGLLAGFSVFFLCLLVVASREGQDAKGLVIADFVKAFLFSLAGLITGFIPAYIYFLVKKRGYRWLWIGFVFQALIVSALLFALNTPNTPLAPLLKIPYVSRLGELSHRAETGTTRVRILIWEGTVDLIRSNPIRMIIGYGPENMKHVWDPYSRPELAKLESKTSAPDRAHNEAFDRIVTTGFIGLVLFLALTASLLCLGLSHIGFCNSNKDRYLFYLFVLSGSILGALLPKILNHSFVLSGVGVCFGFVIAVAAYIITVPLRRRSWEPTVTGMGTQIIVVGVLAALTAHFVEIHFGIAIAATRLYFFSFAAILVVIGRQTGNEAAGTTVPAGEMSSRANNRTEETARGSRKKKSQKQRKISSAEKPVWSFRHIGDTMIWALLTGLLISTMIFFFTSNAKGATDTSTILWLALVGHQNTYGPLILYLATYLLGLSFVFDASIRSSRDTGTPVGYLPVTVSYTATVVGIFLIFFMFHSTYVKPGYDLAGVVTFFSLYVLLISLALAYFLLPPAKELPSVLCRIRFLWLYGIISLFAWWIISETNIAPVKADVYLKLGQANERVYRWNESIRLVTKAIETFPEEETFYLNLGRILFGKANSTNDLNEKNAIFEQIRKTMEQAHSLNPFNTDHIANLGLTYMRWAEFDPSPDSRRTRLSVANSYFQKAAEKSPGKTIIINNWARVLAAQGDFDGAVKKLFYSLSLDDTFAATYVALGDIYGMQGRKKEALQAYEKAVECDQSDADALSMLGLMYYGEGRLEESLAATRKAVQLRPNLMKAQSLLGLIYFKLGRFQEAIDANRKVLAMRPADLTAHRNLIILYEKIGRRDQAIHHVRAAIHFAPPQERQQLEQILRYLEDGGQASSRGSR